LFRFIIEKFTPVKYLFKTAAEKLNIKKNPLQVFQIHHFQLDPFNIIFENKKTLFHIPIPLLLFALVTVRV
jgi:hypothetical protein